MGTQIGIGFSQETTTPEAALRAATQARAQINQAKPDLVIVFTSIHYNPLETLLVVRKTLNNAPLIGCSTAGIILSEMIANRGIAVLAISSDEMKFAVGAVSDLETQDMHKAGMTLARNAGTEFGQTRRQAFLFLIDGLLRQNAPLIKGLHEVLGNEFPVIGAGSSDDFHFRQTVQYFNGQPLHGSAVGAMIGGQMSVGFGRKHGWKPLGKPRTITRSDGNVIYEIDGKRAANLFEEYLGSEARHLRTGGFSPVALLYPLGIYIEEEKEYLLRNAVDILPDGSIVCQGEAPQGAEVHIMLGSQETCRQAAAEAALEAKEGLEGRIPKLILIFEYLGRQKLLGRGAFREIQLIKGILGQHTPIMGMYSLGEIAPFKTKDNTSKNHLQNGSITILAIG